MRTEAKEMTRRVAKTDSLPGYLDHPSFGLPAARKEYEPLPLDTDEQFVGGHMPDDVTRDRAKRMHYAAHRCRTARSAVERRRWLAAYLAHRDSIVLGNRKLVYQAVRKRMAMSNYSEDMVGDCQIVLISAVAAFDPWLGIRFSTYAFTCLVRAISRKSQRLATDRLTRAVSLDAFPEGEPLPSYQVEPHAGGQLRLDEFLQDDHPLLTPREKAIITRRFFVDGEPATRTLEKVGRSLGLSKERVRQVQESALGKLRSVLTGPVTA